MISRLRQASSASPSRLWLARLGLFQPLLLLLRLPVGELLRPDEGVVVDVLVELELAQALRVDRAHVVLLRVDVVPFRILGQRAAARASTGSFAACRGWAATCGDERGAAAGRVARGAVVAHPWLDVTGAVAFLQ